MDIRGPGSVGVSQEAKHKRFLPFVLGVHLRDTRESADRPEHGRGQEKLRQPKCQTPAM